MRRRRSLDVAAAILLSLAGRTAFAGDHFGGQRNLGGGPTLGLWSGAGALVVGGTETVKLWLSGGYEPLFVVGNQRTTKAVRFNYYGSAQANADLSIRVLERNRIEMGLLLGYKYNTVGGHGGGAGVMFLYDLGRHVALSAQVGLALFPSMHDRLVRDQGYPADRDPATPWLVGGVNGGVVFF